MYPSKKLREVGTITTGYTPSKLNKEFWGGETLFIKPPHLRTDKIITETEETLSDLGRAKGKLIKKNSIMVCCIGSLGKIGIAGENVCTNQQINSIFFDDKVVNFKYGYYFCTTLEKLMNKIANKAIIAIINKTTFSEILIPLPPLSIQSRIVARLDTAFANIDEQISLLRANISDVENMRKTVLKESFQSGEYLMKNFGDIVDNFDGMRKPVKSSDRAETQGIFPYYGASGIIDYVNEYIFDGEYLLVSEDGANLVARKYPIAFLATDKFWVNNHAHIVRGKKGISDNKYLSYYFASADISDYVSGAAQPKLNQKNLNQIQIPLPPLSHQHEIVAHLDRVFATTEALRGEYEARIRDLETLRQSLLEEAFAGRLVPEEDEA